MSLQHRSALAGCPSRAVNCAPSRLPIQAMTSKHDGADDAGPRRYKLLRCWLHVTLWRAAPVVPRTDNELSKRPVARLAVHKLMRSGTIKEMVLTIKGDDDLEEKTGRIEYQGYLVEEISYGGKFIRFANNAELRVGEESGVDEKAIFETQLRYTIEEYLRKQARLRGLSIKVLSLVFIDKVANYVAADGPIRQRFDRIFNEVKSRYPDWKDRKPTKVRSAYFATRNRRDRINWIQTI